MFLLCSLIIFVFLEKKYHKVKSGETIGKIAKKYNVEEGIIFKLNKLNSRSIIRPGQTIRYQ